MSAFAPKSLAEAKEHAARRAAKKAAKPPKRKTKPKKKRVKLSTLKRKAWVQFSIFIRARGADAQGMQTCFTCDVVKFWREFEAGHLVPGRTNAVLFDERSVRPQCRRCNGHFRGNVIVFYPKMVRLFGQAIVDEIVAQRDVTHKWEPDELLNIYLKYKTLNDANPLARTD